MGEFLVPDPNIDWSREVPSSKDNDPVDTFGVIGVRIGSFAVFLDKNRQFQQRIVCPSSTNSDPSELTGSHISLGTPGDVRARVHSICEAPFDIADFERINGVVSPTRDLLTILDQILVLNKARQLIEQSLGKQRRLYYPEVCSEDELMQRIGFGRYRDLWQDNHLREHGQDATAKLEALGVGFVHEKSGGFGHRINIDYYMEYFNNPKNFCS